MKYIKANFLNFLILIGIGIFVHSMIEDNHKLKTQHQATIVTINKFAQAIQVSTDPIEKNKFAKNIESLTEQPKPENTEKK